MTITSSEDLARLVGRSFIQRRDAFARQWGEGENQYLQKGQAGAYSPVRTKWLGPDVEREYIRMNVGHLMAHLKGDATYGHYLLDAESMLRVISFDVDFAKVFIWNDQEVKPRQIFGTDHPAARSMVFSVRSVADTLAFRLKSAFPHLKVCTSFSGSKGIHVYGLFPQPVPAETGRSMALDVIANSPLFERGKCEERDKDPKGEVWWRPRQSDHLIDIEVFPKQDTVGHGQLGNLMKIPLGWHRKTLRPSYFYDPHSDPYTLDQIDPVNAITVGLNTSHKAAA